MKRSDGLYAAAVIAAAAGLLIAWAWKATCVLVPGDPRNPFLPDTTNCDSHLPLRIGIAAAGLILGAILASIASGSSSS